MTKFEMIKYHSQEYPSDVTLNIEECAAHFDVASVNACIKKSLHTEYSYGKRNFDTEYLKNFPEILNAQKNNIPQLWKNTEWSKQFSDFVIGLFGDDTPSVIEIHPPFNDYTNMVDFIENYKIFENKILTIDSNIEILIENRCGSIYRGGKFLISKLEDIEKLCELIEKNKLKLKIAYDIPQIYTAHNARRKEVYVELLKKTIPLRSYIGGVHLWGKRRALAGHGRLVSHCGDLNSYFDNNLETKQSFLKEFKNCFDDDICRKMVLEVNSGNDDLLSIITNLKSVGITFA